MEVIPVTKLSDIKSKYYVKHSPIQFKIRLIIEFISTKEPHITINSVVFNIHHN